MGCDIHGFVEVKLKGRGEWLTFSEVRIERWYSLFAKIAGVRVDDVPPVSPPKGFPVDAAVVTKLSYDWWDADAHTPTWLTAREAAEVEAWARPQSDSLQPVFGWIFNNDVGAFIDPDGEPPEEVEDVRVVLWFDN